MERLSTKTYFAEGCHLWNLVNQLLSVRKSFSALKVAPSLRFRQRQQTLSIGSWDSWSDVVTEAPLIKMSSKK